MWHITAPKGSGGNAGIYFSQVNNVSNVITQGQQWTFSFDIKGTGVYSDKHIGVEASNPFNSPTGNVPSDWTRVFSTGTATGRNAIIIYFNSIDVALDVYIKLPKLEIGNIATDWIPAPEDVDSNIAQVKLTADGLYEKVNNPTTGIATRLLAAEGAVTTVQNATKELTSKQTVTAGGLTQEISDRKNGDQAVRTDMATLINQQVTSVTTGYKSSLLETSNALVAQISSLNLLNNSQFEVVNGTLPGWHVDTPWGDTVKVGAGTSNNVSVNGPNPDGTTSLIHDQGGNSTSWLFSDPIPTMPNSTFSGSFELAEGSGWATSSQISFARNIRYYTSDHVLISLDTTNYYGGSIGGAWPRYSFTVKTPENAAYVSFGMGWNGGKVSFRHLSMYSGSKDYGYMPGSKSGNQTVLQLFKDNWAIGIKDNAGNLINGINGDNSGVRIAAKQLIVSADTTFQGINWLDGAIIRNASIGTAQIANAAIGTAQISSLDVAKISGNTTNFIKSNWNSAYNNVTIDSTGMIIKSSGASASISTFKSNMQEYKFYIDNTLYVANKITPAGITIRSNITRGAAIKEGSVMTMGGNTDGFSVEKSPYGLNVEGIEIGDPNGAYKAENMAFGISMAQSTGVAPQLIWAGSATGKVIASNGKTWDNPAGWIIPDNIRFSTWDSSASQILFDSTTKMVINSQRIEISQQRASDHGWSTMMVGLKYVGRDRQNWIGFTDGSGGAGVGFDGTQDVWIVIKGLAYSMYDLFGRVGMR
ncbi:hypothetical protein EFL81_09880 [Weissella confusa]|nr:hypothetical protein [Weissella confusa]